MKEIIVIGAGPAGISAALYTKRAGINTTIIYKDIGALAKAEHIENYYGFREPISGTELAHAGLVQADRLGVKFVQGEVFSISYMDKFVIESSAGEYTADSVIVATGSPKSAPKIEGIKQFEGKGVSYCAVCDAFFYRGREIAVLGCCDFALHELHELLPVVRSATVITNGDEPTVKFPKNVSVITQKIRRIGGDDRVRFVEFVDNTRLEIEGIFVAYGVAGSSQLAKVIGAATENNKIITDDNMETTIPGLFAAGDCTGRMFQIARAVYEGAMAGTSAVKFLRRQK
ncbi:MAG: NAD(P)/FAD-dependent oxidoreductase [Clostridiales bacterium]|nr:NAD(P)/FAD-dependent oxidoreductase [Clostridiales bacterium]